MWYTDQNSLWVVGEYGTLLSASNNGTSWENHVTPTIAHLYAFRAVAERFWIAGEGGIILSSTDAGVSWQLQNSGTQNNLNRIQFLNRDNGFAMGSDHILLHTSNGGFIWNADSVPEPLQRVYGSTPFNDFAFVSPSKGWIASGDYSSGNLDSPPSSEGGLLQTTDGGSTWSILDSGRTAYLAIYFLDSSNGWISSANANTGSVVLRTSDGGLTWQPGEHTLPWKRMHFVTSLVGWALFSNLLGKTTDGGRTWQVSAPPSYANSVRFTDLMNGWLVGTSGEVYRTSDGGITWSDCTKRLDIYFAGLNDVVFANSSKGWIGGKQYASDPDNDTSLVLRTTNGGATWERLSFPYGGGIYGLFAVDDSRLWAITDDLAFFTTDGGDNWSKANVRDEDGIFRDIYFRDPDWGVILGSEALYKTTDGGISWQRQAGFEVMSLRSIRFASLSRGWIVGHLRSGPEPTYETTDGGATWNLTTLGFQSISFVDSLNGFALAESSHVFRTTNGGISWSPIYSGSLSSVSVRSCLNFADTLVGWIWRSGVYKTTDGGATWSPERGIHGYVGWVDHGFFVESSQSAWAVASDGRIFKYGSFPTDVRIKNLREHLKDFTLYQNFPNPFNSETVIEYVLPRSADVRLSVYDILGRGVSVLVNERMAAGVHEVKFDASGLSSGVYFYRLTAGSFVQTRKLLLLR